MQINTDREHKHEDFAVVSHVQKQAQTPHRQTEHTYRRTDLSNPFRAHAQVCTHDDRRMHLLHIQKQPSAHQ